jgi:hypothetical protein
MTYQKKPVVIVFKQNGRGTNIDQFKSFAEKSKDSGYLFAISDRGDKAELKIAEYFGVTRAVLPALFIWEPETGKKYQFGEKFKLLRED